MEALSIEQVNLLDHDAFVAAFGGIVEHSPWVAEAAWSRKPFADRAAIHAAMLEALLAATPAQQLEVVRAHPDLAGRAAVAGDLTPQSTREQATAGLTTLSAEQYAEFNRLNDAYQARFGFPFVICVREHDKAGILRSFEQRLAHDSAQELRTAVDEIGKIAALRLGDVVA